MIKSAIFAIAFSQSKFSGFTILDKSGLYKIISKAHHKIN
jgi:hypothetical protein